MNAEPNRFFKPPSRTGNCRVSRAEAILKGEEEAAAVVQRSPRKVVAHKPATALFAPTETDSERPRTPKKQSPMHRVNSGQRLFGIGADCDINGPTTPKKLNDTFRSSVFQQIPQYNGATNGNGVANGH